MATVVVCIRVRPSPCSTWGGISSFERRPTIGKRRVVTVAGAVGGHSEAPLVPPDRLHGPSKAMALRLSPSELTTTFQNRKSSMAKQNIATGTTPLRVCACPTSGSWDFLSRSAASESSTATQSRDRGTLKTSRFFPESLLQEAVKNRGRRVIPTRSRATKPGRVIPVTHRFHSPHEQRGRTGTLARPTA